MDRSIKELFIIIIIAAFAFFQLSTFHFQLPKAFAQEPCQPIYGGGPTCTASPSITPTPAETIKGRFPILTPPPVKTTPATGPESLMLFSLIPIGLVGWFLRRKSKRGPAL